MARKTMAAHLHAARIRLANGETALRVAKGLQAEIWKKIVEERRLAVIAIADGYEQSLATAKRQRELAIAHVKRLAKKLITKINVEEVNSERVKA